MHREISFICRLFVRLQNLNSIPVRFYVLWTNLFDRDYVLRFLGGVSIVREGKTERTKTNRLSGKNVCARIGAEAEITSDGMRKAESRREKSSYKMSRRFDDKALCGWRGKNKGKIKR